MHGAQRAFDKVDRLFEQASAATCELGPYAINWSDEEQKIYILSRKEQRQTRRWWRQLHSFGLRRERGGYDIVAYMEWVQAAVDAEVWPGVSKSSCRRLSMRANRVRKCYLRPMFAARVPVPISSDGSPIWSGVRHLIGG